MITQKHKKVCTNLNDIEQCLNLASTITWYVATFASLVGIPTGISSSAIWLKICAITAGMKKY